MVALRLALQRWVGRRGSSTALAGIPSATTLENPSIRRKVLPKNVATSTQRMTTVVLSSTYDRPDAALLTHSIRTTENGHIRPMQRHTPTWNHHKHRMLKLIPLDGFHSLKKIHFFSTASIPIPSMEKSSFKVTRVDYDGDMKTINLPPAEILKRTSILPRDLVSLNLTTRHERYMDMRTGKHQRTNGNIFHARPPPTAILPRSSSSTNVSTSTLSPNQDANGSSKHGTDKSCILLSFGLCRAVATRYSVYLFDTHRPVAKEFANELSTIFTSGEYKYIEPSPELVFLEAVLRDTTETYSRRIRLYEPIVDDVLDRVASEVFNENGSVHQLSPLKDSLQTFEMQVQKAHECLTELLKDDETMLQLLLTEQAIAKESGLPVDFERHQHVELLIGGYARQLGTILQEINFLLGRIQSKQEFVTLALAGYRNRLIYLNVIIGIAGVSTGITTAICGAFGMNLISGLEESAVAFGSVIAISAGTSSVVAAICMNYLSGRTMQQRATQRLNELETLNSALSDMSALDFTIKRMTDGKIASNEQPGYGINRTQFKKELIKARRSAHATDEEVDLLFNVFDRVKDGHLTREDFLDEISSSSPHTAS